MWVVLSHAKLTISNIIVWLHFDSLFASRKQSHWTVKLVLKLPFLSTYSPLNKWIVTLSYSGVDLAILIDSSFGERISTLKSKVSIFWSMLFSVGEWMNLCNVPPFWYETKSFQISFLLWNSNNKSHFAWFSLLIIVDCEHSCFNNKFYDILLVYLFYIWKQRISLAVPWSCFTIRLWTRATHLQTPVTCK